MKLHPNYIKELENRYKDISYKDFIDNYKKSELFGRSTSSWRIESLPDDAKWVSKKDMRDEMSNKSQDEYDLFMDREKENILKEAINLGINMESEEFKKFALKRLKPKIEKFHKPFKDELDNKFFEYGIYNLSESFPVWESPNIGKTYQGYVTRSTFNFWTYDDPEVEKLLDYIKKIPNFEQLSKLRVTPQSSERSNEIIDYLTDRDKNDFLSYGDGLWEFLEQSGEDKGVAPDYQFLKLDMNNGDIIDCNLFIKINNEPQYLEQEGYWTGYEFPERQPIENITFLNPISGKWERVVLKYCEYDFGSFDYKKPGSDLLNYQGFQNYVENIKKYGKK